jgi:signal transduction histidine kinase
VRGDPGLAGWAPILSGGEAVGWVEVRVDPRPEQRALGLIAFASGLLGLFMALALHRFPTRVVRRQAGVLAGVLAQLRGAEAALTEANQKLQGRVEEAVGEVRRLSERVVRIQEEERRRIARDLHDSVGQQLTALQLELTLARNQPDQAGSHLAEAARCSEEALGEVRRVVHDLRPPELASAELPEILRSYVERFEARTGIAAAFRLSGTAAPSEEVATCLLRVLQEALTNVARHAAATEVGIALALGAEAVLEIWDDGKGFEPGAPRSGSGLRGIDERCAFLQGTMELEAEVGGGTRLRVRLPLGEGAR